jgi:hypothetical protein
MNKHGCASKCLHSYLLHSILHVTFSERYCSKTVLELLITFSSIKYNETAEDLFGWILIIRVNSFTVPSSKLNTAVTEAL